MTGVRIVPGFGVNILSGPCLERRHKLTLRSNGRIWEAKDRRRNTVLHGPADGGGLYWARLTRLPTRGGRNITSRQHGGQREGSNDDPGHHSSKRARRNCGGPSDFGWSSKIDSHGVRGERVTRESENSTLSFATREERAEISNLSDSSELSDERERLTFFLYLCLTSLSTHRRNHGYQAAIG